jgi:CelD/BcsL family acetyltransferase involved in cellulose biosynthesis
VTGPEAGDAAFVETPALPDLARHEAAWLDLADRAAEPNAFADSAFIIPALERLAAAGRIATLLVWDNAARRRLIGVAAIEFPRLPFGLARVWRSEQAGLAAVALDADAAERALRAILVWFRRERRGVAGLVLPAVETNGPIAHAVMACAASQALRLEIVDRRRRAALPAGPTSRFEADVDKKRRKEWARQRRRLEERGRLESKADDSASGVEAFLALEQRGWKGARGSALAADADRTAFTREMLARFAARDRLRVHSLALDGEPIAIGLALRSGARAFYWKTAYDERFAEYSPGLQLSLDFSRRLENEPGLTLIDSCAIPGHPMIERMWRGRLDLADFALALRAGPARRFALALGAASAKSQLKELAKRAIYPLLRRKRS